MIQGMIRKMTATFFIAAVMVAAPPSDSLSPVRAAASAVNILERHPNPTHIRVVWCPDYASHNASYPTTQEMADVVAYVANSAMGHGPLVYRSEGAGDLVFINLLDQAFGDAKTLERLLNTYEKLLPFNSVFQGEVEGVRVVHPAVADSFARMKALTGSSVPLIRYDDFVVGAFSSINGGLYYEWRGFKAGETKRDDWHSFNFSFPTTAEQAGSLRAAYQRGSLVTGRDNYRVVKLWPSIRGKDGIGIPSFATDDMDDENTENPDYNIFSRPVSYKTDGHEDIVPLANGLQLYGIFNAAGILVASVPEGIARDSTIESPGGGTNILHTRGCVVCHSTVSEGVAEDGTVIYPNGYRSLRDDLTPILESSPLVLDLSQADQEAVRRQLESYVRGDLEEAVGAARQSYRVAVAEVTGGRMTVQQLGTAFAKIYDDRVWGVVTPEQAALESGYANSTLQAVMPAVANNESELTRVHPDIKQLLIGASLPRARFRHVYPEIIDIAWLNPNGGKE